MEVPVLLKGLAIAVAARRAEARGGSVIANPARLESNHVQVRVDARTDTAAGIAGCHRGAPSETRRGGDRAERGIGGPGMRIHDPFCWRARRMA